MKTKSITTVCLAAILCGFLNTSRAQASKEDGFNVCIYPVLLPDKSSPDWDSRATAVVNAIYASKLSMTNLGDHLDPAFITQQSPNLTNDTLWFVVHAWSKNPTNMLSISQLVMTEWSSDTGNAFGQYLPICLTTNLVYGPHSLGAVWASGGHGSDTLYANGSVPGTVPVNEICFAAIQSGYYKASLGAVSNELAKYTNYVIVGSCLVTNGNGGIVAQAHKSLQTTRTPRQPDLSIAVSGGIARIGFNVETNVSFQVWSAVGVRGPWVFEGTGNAGDFFWRSGTETQHYYKARTE